ncbi:glycosyltransferase [Jiella marina]|uniref:glycosyltransferase n=1 Tax=Jiella sp. LLJ827 TaxID=2917712 RepID=UPI0021013458|nr:glycosyltransferase [Jiella sp. LLJ827]MCQ0988467.1 glycosyltransferase [Jiella sp. LLJ827]
MIQGKNAPSKTASLWRSAGALIKQGDRANAERRWSDAQRAYAEALNRNPRLHAVWVQYGHALKEQGFYAEAEKAYRRSIALVDDSADTYLQLGHALKLQSKTSEAIEAYRQAHFRDPALPYSTNELRTLGGAIPEAAEIAAFQRQKAASAALSGKSDAQGNPAIASPTPSFEANTIERLLLDNGISLNLLHNFDPEYYYHANRFARADLKTTDRNTCLKHFVSKGIDRLCVFRERYEFEADFYVETYTPGTTFAQPSDAYRHYLSKGLADGYWPNRRLWLEATLGAGARSLGEIELPTFVGTEVANTFVSRMNALMRDVLVNPSSHLVIEPRHAQLLVLIADRLVLEGRDDEALLAYQKILQAVPDFTPALRHYADCLLRRQCYLQAGAIYEQLAEQDDAHIWTFINLAHCREMVGDLHGALAWLRKGSQRFPSDLGIRRRFHDMGPRFLTASWRLAGAAAEKGELHEGLARIEADCDRVHDLVVATDTAERRYARSVALVSNLDLPQCRFYRVDQKVEQLKAAGFAVEVFDFRNGVDAFLEKVHCFDVAIFFRVPAYYEIIRSIEKAREIGCAVFYEIDDLIFDSDLYPPPLENFDNQITIEEHNGLALGAPLFRSALRYCDHALVSTKPLIPYVDKIAPGTRSFVHPNALSSPHAQHIGHVVNNHSGDRVTIFYGSGTKAHKQDFQELVVPALLHLARKYGDRISIVLAGYMTAGPKLQEIEDQLILLPPVWDVHQYWSTLSAADINLAVLKPAPTTDVKSEIKWLEAAMLGIPSVVSDTALYRDILDDGVDGLLCRTPEDWTRALERLVKDADLRRRVGEKAREKALTRYSIPAMAESITETIRAVTLPEPDKRKRVLIVNVFYPPQAIGGATRVVHDNVRHLKQKYSDEFSFEVFCSIEGASEGYKVSSHASDGVRVVGVTTPDLPDIDRRVHDEEMGKVFSEYLDVCQPDIIHFHCIQRLTTAIVLEARRRGIPYVITAHDGWWISDEQFLLGKDDRIVLYDHGNPASQLGKIPAEKFAGRMQLRECLMGAERVLAVSNAFADIHRSVGLTNVLSVPNGASQIEPLPRKPSPDGKVRLGFIGGLARHKGFHLIQSALLSEDFQNLRFVLIDHAMPAGSTRRGMLGTTELDIRPKVPQARVAELYSELDVLVAPSVWPEAYGLVTREALTCGCWVLASDRGAIGEDVIVGENGFKVDVSSPQGIVNALREIDRNPERYLRSPGVKPELRTAGDQADELVGIYRELIGEAAARSGHDLDQKAKTIPDKLLESRSVETERVQAVING